MNFFARMFAGSRVPDSIVREYTSIKFLWSKSLPGHEDIFEEVSESKLQPGDILLFPESNANFISRALFKHGAVYCWDGEVIHFQSADRGHIGLISKQGFEALKRERGECHIYRKKGGVDLNDLWSKVRMDSEAEYSLCTNNCIHFALSLLGLEKFYSELVQIQDEDDSCSTGALPALRGHPSARAGKGRDSGDSPSFPGHL
ncbi:uncharacterized protein LOC135575261 [Columba livia]|uniref:uncharacterized protein LOC135575261 n=1 Tax=Columba livia TaxID=8932 RepID=UPI0028C2F343|nr:hypothetical protein Q9966_004894 [Columba livia]